MSTTWYKTDPKFYGLSTSAEENVEVTEFESGKKRYTLKNSTPRHTFSVSFTLTSRTDENNFWTWYENNLYSRAETVQLIDFITHSSYTEYRMTSEPAVQDSQYPKEVQVEFEEE